MPYSSILDEIHPTLDPQIWDEPGAPEPKLKPHHAEFIHKHIYSVLVAAGYADPHTWLHLVLTGSLTTRQYGDSSDVDTSLFVESAHLPEWSRAEMIGLMIESADGTLLPGTSFPLQCFVVPSQITTEQLYRPGLRSGYDIDMMHWLVPPDPNRDHDVQAQENGFYMYALESADKLERMIRYEPDKAIQYWHAIHRRRHDDQAKGKGDFAESNILYKFLNKRGLFEQLSQLTGEHIAASENPFGVTVRTMKRDGYNDEDIADWSNYLAQHNEDDRDTGELDDVSDEQVERWYENWETEGRPHIASRPNMTSSSKMLYKRAAVPIAQKAYEGIVANQGVTISLNGVQPTSGYSYSTDPQQTTVPVAQLTPEAVGNYIANHMTELQEPNRYFGAWVENGLVYLDVAQVEVDYATAYQQAHAAQQKAMFDLATFKEIPTTAPFSSPLSI
jgi:hypothetical protein